MRRTSIVALLMTLMLAACGGTESAPLVPGELVVRVVGQGTSPGAMVLTISGGPITKATPIAGVQGALSSDAAGSHLLLVGSLVSGDLAVVTIPDKSLAARYLVTVSQIADGTTFSLIDVAGRNASLVARP